MASWGGEGVAAGLDQWRTRNAETRSTLAKAFREMLAENPNASAADVDQWAVSQLGPTDYYLKGSLPSGQHLESLRQGILDKKKEAELKRKLEEYDSRVGLREKVEGMIDSQLLNASPNDYQKIIGGVIETLGAKDDPEVSSMVSAIAGDMDARRKKVQNKHWLEYGDKYQRAYDDMVENGLEPTKQQFENMVGQPVSDEMYGRVRDKTAEKQRRSNAEFELKLVKAESELSSNELMARQLAISGDDQVVRAQVKSTLAPIVKPDELDARVDKVMAGLQQQASLYRQQAARDKQKEAVGVITQGAKGWGEQLRYIVPRLDEKVVGKEFKSGVETLAIQ